MFPATIFPLFWALTFSTLCVAFFALMLFYRFAGSELELRGVRRESIFVAVTSLAQATAVWLCAPVMAAGGLLAIAVAIAAIIYWLAHYPDWGFFEALGLAIFEWILWIFIFCMIGGDFGPACIILILFVVGLAVIIGFGKSL